MKGDQHWRENKKTCGDRCGSEEENIMYVLNKCKATKDEKPTEEFLSEEGQDCNAMKRINKVRMKRKREKEKGM